MTTTTTMTTTPLTLRNTTTSTSTNITTAPHYPHSYAVMRPIATDVPCSVCHTLLLDTSDPRKDAVWVSKEHVLDDGLPFSSIKNITYIRIYYNPHVQHHHTQFTQYNRLYKIQSAVQVAEQTMQINQQAQISGAKTPPRWQTHHECSTAYQHNPSNALYHRLHRVNAALTGAL